MRKVLTFALLTTVVTGCQRMSPRPAVTGAQSPTFTHFDYDANEWACAMSFGVVAPGESVQSIESSSDLLTWSELGVNVQGNNDVKHTVWFMPVDACEDCKFFRLRSIQ